MKKKEKVSKKKEESIAHSSWYHIAKPRDLTIENWSTDMDKAIKDNIDVVWTHRIKAEVIDAPTQYIATFPKELPCAGLGCMIYNALEREKGSNVVWRVG